MKSVKKYGMRIKSCMINIHSNGSRANQGKSPVPETKNKKVTQ